MSVRKTISFEEKAIEDAQFIAKYQGRSLSAYIRKCVEAENQKRLKSIQIRINEELHYYNLFLAPQRWGNESESKKMIGLFVEDYLKERDRQNDHQNIKRGDRSGC